MPKIKQNKRLVLIQRTFLRQIKVLKTSLRAIKDASGFVNSKLGLTVRFLKQDRSGEIPT
jgi:hypothetical protein